MYTDKSITLVPTWLKFLPLIGVMALSVVASGMYGLVTLL